MSKGEIIQFIRNTFSTEKNTKMEKMRKIGQL